MNLRDLFEGAPIVNPTLREVASNNPELNVPKEVLCSAILPGDPTSVEQHLAYPKGAVTRARESIERLQETVAHRVANPEEGPIPEPEFDEDAFHSVFHPPSDPGMPTGIQRADVWPWPDRDD